MIEQKEPMDGIRMLADRIDDDKMIPGKDDKALLHSACGYAECLMKLNELMQAKPIEGVEEQKNT